MARTRINPAQVNTSSIITGVYAAFYVQPSQTGTVGNSYAFTVNLPRAAVTGETVILIPIAAKWCTVELTGNTTTQFSFTLNCVVATSLMTSSWTAIYVKSN